MTVIVPSPPACFPRSRGQYLAAIDSLQLESNPVFLPGNGLTHCNQAVRKGLELLGVAIPALLANDLFGWFPSPAGVVDGWRHVSKKEAQDSAELGLPTIGVWRNLKGPHGHIVFVVPAIGGTGMHSAQAGARNWSNAPIEGAGLSADAYSYFVHP